jgi:hypothetical protein
MKCQVVDVDPSNCQYVIKMPFFKTFFFPKILSFLKEIIIIKTLGWLRATPLCLGVARKPPPLAWGGLQATTFLKKKIG